MVTTPVKYIRNRKIWGVLENSAYMNILHDKHQTFKIYGEMIEEIVKLRQGSGKDRQGMALKAKGLKAYIKVGCYLCTTTTSIHLTIGQLR